MAPPSIFLDMEKPLVNHTKQQQQQQQYVQPETPANEIFKEMSFPTVDVKSPWFPALHAAHNFYLATASLNIMILVLFVALVVNYFVVISFQGEVTSSDKSTFLKYVSGPVLIICVTGILFALVVFINRNNGDNLFNVSRSFLLVTSLLFLFWSIADKSQLTKFALPSLEKATNDSQTFIFLIFVLFILTSAVSMYLKGDMRLDIMNPLSNTMFIFIIVVALFVYAMTHIFGLLLRTVHSMRINLNIKNKMDDTFTEDIIEGMMYVGGIVFVLFLSMAAIGFLEANLYMMINLVRPGGVASIIHVKGAGNNTQRVLAQTADVYRHSLMICVVIIAAITWNRRNFMVTFSKPESAESILKQWSNLGVIFLLGPICAMLVEASRSVSGTNHLIYETFFTVFAAIFLVYFSIVYVPWDKYFLIAAMAVMFVVLWKYFQSRNNTSNIISSLVLGGIFVFAQLVFRGTMGKDKIASDSNKAYTWTSSVIIPSFLMLMYSLLPLITRGSPLTSTTSINGVGSNDAIYDYPSFHVIRIFFVFALVYTVLQPFIDTGGDLTALETKDSVMENIVPNNDSASIAVSGILLTAILMIVGMLFKIIVPVKKQAASSPFAIVLYIILGCGTALTFSNIKQSDWFNKFVKKHQKTQKWQINLYRDIFA